MSTDALNAINTALETLAAANCRRANGVWVDQDGRELAPDPVAAARALRRETIATAVRNCAERGERFTR